MTIEGKQITDYFSPAKRITEVIQFAKARTGKAVIHEFGPLDVKEIRVKVGICQHTPSLGVE